ncbi:hypothetical protein D3C87_44930 [compost metagenome]
MKNKTIHKKPTVPGKFTTIHHSILLDTRLTSTAFRVLLCILMDSDRFNISRTLIANRLGVDKKTVKLAFKKLAECGYLRQTPIDKKNGFYYTISEYGNLAGEGDNDFPHESLSHGDTDVPVAEHPILESTSGRLITQEELQFVLKFLSSKNRDEHFEKVVDELGSELSNGLISVITEAAIMKKIPKVSESKRESPSSLGEVRQLYKNPKLFDTLLPFVQEHAGGHMITQQAKDTIIRRTMTKFADADDGLTDKKVKNYISSIKGEYTNAGKLDQRYQN